MLRPMSNLVTENLPLVRSIAKAIYRRMGDSARAVAEFDELVSAGTLALIERASTFDPSRGLAFRTHAQVRIYGAMIDVLRNQGIGGAAGNRRMRFKGETTEHVDVDFVADELMLDASSLDDETDAKLRLARLEPIVSAMPERTRFMLERRIAGDSLEEITAVVGLCRSHVWKTTKAAVREMRAALEG